MTRAGVEKSYNPFKLVVSERALPIDFSAILIMVWLLLNI